MTSIFVYSDESGVFDKAHNSIYAFGGVVFLSRDDRDEYARRYSKAEKDVRASVKIFDNCEIKASAIDNKFKAKLFRSLNGAIKFGVIVNQERVLDRIFSSKKDKQRYLDYVYKIGVKRCFENLINSGKLDSQDVGNIHFWIDEHTTATNGCYELHESLEQEFKNGTYSCNYCAYHPPIFPNLLSLQLDFCNSNSKLLVRASDIVANRVRYLGISKPGYHSFEDNFYVIQQP